MARPQKDGLDYFPKDTGFYRDRKIRALIGRFGSDGAILYDYILCEVYGDKGYYTEIDDSFIDIAAADLLISPEKIGLILNYLLDKSMLLDGTLFKAVKVLTSHGIQTRYQEAVRERAKKRGVVVHGELWLLNEAESESFVEVRQNDNFSRKNLNKSGKNNSLSREKSLKESKVKESKVKESLTVPKGTVCRTSDVRRIIEAWNSLNLQTIKQIQPDTDRGKMVRKRVKDYGVDDVLAAIGKVRESAFLMGNNQRGWQITFDWFIRPNNFPKVLSGNYDNNKAKGKSSNVFLDLLESGDLDDNS